MPGVGDDVAAVRTPVHLTDGSVPLGAKAPALGEHTDAALAALGYDATAVAALRAARIV